MADPAPAPSRSVDDVVQLVELSRHPEIEKYTIGRVWWKLGASMSAAYVDDGCWRVAFTLDGEQVDAYHVGHGRPGTMDVDADGGTVGVCEARWLAGV